MQTDNCKICRENSLTPRTAILQHNEHTILCTIYFVLTKYFYFLPTVIRRDDADLGLGAARLLDAPVRGVVALPVGAAALVTFYRLKCFAFSILV